MGTFETNNRVHRVHPAAKILATPLPIKGLVLGWTDKTD